MEDHLFPFRAVTAGEQLWSNSSIDSDKAGLGGGRSLSHSHAQKRHHGAEAEGGIPAFLDTITRVLLEKN